MKHLFTCTAVAASLLLAGAAHASVQRFNTGNSTLAFIALDNVGTPTSLFVDLGYRLADFNPVVYDPDTFDRVPTNAALLAQGTTVVWDFNANTISVNGVTQASPDNQWSDQFATFMQNAQSSELRYGVIAGSRDGFPNYFLTTGNPTANQLGIQLAINSANMVNIDVLYANTLGKGTVPGFGVNNSVNGAFAQVGGGAASTGYVGNSGNFGSAGNWQANLNWSALVPHGEASQFWALNDNEDLEFRAGVPFGEGLGFDGGTFTYADGVLTWAVPVPEPGTYALMLAGLAAVGSLARRRRAP